VDDIKAIISDQTGLRSAAHSLDDWRPSDGWAPVIIKCADIDAEIERLASASKPANGRRASLFVHPSAANPGQGLTPGVQVCLSVLKPGESTLPVRHNSTQVNFCIRGEGRTVVNGRTINFRRYDTWNHPSFATYQHFNDSRDIQVRLTYSNAALLEMMRIHIVDEAPPMESKETGNSEKTIDPRRSSPFGTFAIGGGAMLMPYETLINPPSVDSSTLHWPWLTVQEHLDKLAALGEDYVGRRLYLLYNPKTGQTNGTTPNFFATITIRPPNIIDRPHRHVSSAINYYFRGSGYSVVDGKRYEWGAGDLMVSAPGWAVHNHASYDEAVYELTVQDQPLNIQMESLLWQESLKNPPIILGTSSGFATNRASIAQIEGA
jgi:gentisate 1,2-dioxygenase